MKRLLITSFILVYLSLLSSFSFARTWYIKPDSTGDAPTIQAGVDSAIAGDTVLVAPGTYSDTRQILINNELKTVNIFITKNIILISDGLPANTIIDGSNSEIAIYVQNVDSTGAIKGFGINTTFFDWSADLGPSQIFALVDPPLASNGSYDEWNETKIKLVKIFLLVLGILFMEI